MVLEPPSCICSIEMLRTSIRFNKTQPLVQKVKERMKLGHDPVLVQRGMGGTYCFNNDRHEGIAIVKPTDEEPFAPNNPKRYLLGRPGVRKRSFQVGETGYREAAVYILDHNNFAKVPPTTLVKMSHHAFNVNDEGSRGKSRVRIASIQKFVPHDFDAGEHGNENFPVSDVHRIGILDIRTLNTDRHSGNLLVRKVNDHGVEKFEVIPIDHGLCLPENLEDPYFEWLYWRQASIPFTEEDLKYIEALDPYQDADMLKTELPMIRKGCLRVLILSTTFLQKTAAYGLTLYEIGKKMSRRSEKEPSGLELLCMKAMDGVREVHQDPIQFEIDNREDSWPNRSVLAAHNYVSKEKNEVEAFVKLGDMKDEVWPKFLVKFKEQLDSAF